MGGNIGIITAKDIISEIQKQSKKSDPPSPSEINEMVKSVTHRIVNTKFVCDHELEEFCLYVNGDLVETIQGTVDFANRIRLLNLLNIKYDIE